MKKYIWLFLFFTSCTFAKVYANDTIINFAKSTSVAGSLWKYLDNNTNLDGIMWKDSNYVDASWNTGNSLFGYGNSFQNTTINDGCTPQGSNCSNKYITTYFRKTLLIPTPNIYQNFILQYKRDDGIEIFVNGVRVEINNLSDPVMHGTLATSAADNGQNIYSVNLSPSLFFGDGKRNVIAVDIHQSGPGSPDVTFDLQLIGVKIPVITRGPYLQMGKQDSISIRWRTSAPTNSVIKWGATFGLYNSVKSNSTLTTEHELRIGNLSPDTKYYYSVEANGIIFQNDISNYFVTSPRDIPNRKMRFIALGDCGNGSSNQRRVKDIYLSYIGSNTTDGMLLLGDNAYGSGLDYEYQTSFFDIYKDDLLKNIKLYPAPGNHDYANYGSLQGSRNTPYYNTFSMPTAGQLGGVPSGTEAYYSYNIGNVHFVSLDSYGQEDVNSTRLYDTTGAQVTWLKSDLDANTKTWTVVYFHHPPYTKTSHNSDMEIELVSMREKFIRILERYGVDLVLSGHSHGYERSYLLKNYYNTAANPLSDIDFNASLHTATGNLQNGKNDGTALSCPYTYDEGKIKHGTIYVVAGSAGQVGGTSTGYPHDAMCYSNSTNGGLFYFEVDDNKLEGKFISYNGSNSVSPIVRDQFTIMKNVNKIKNVRGLLNAPLTLKASWNEGFFWPATNAVTNSITVPTNVLGNFDYIVKDAPINNCLKDSFRVVISATLPVSLISFKAQYINSKVDLTWATSQEINSDYYLLEKSVDGTNFNYLSKTKAAGNSTRDTYYESIDANPVYGENYYRLWQIDVDGRKTNLGLQKIIKEDKNKFDFVTKQFVAGEVLINVFDVISKTFELNIYDVSGKTIINKTINKNISINLPMGIYFIKLKNEQGEIISKKLQVY
jgi:3',5'-cyclic AMP phosphodiesterase CpdA